MTNFLLVIYAFYTLGANALTPLWAHFTQYLGGDLRSSGFAVSIYFLSYGTSTFFLSLLENKYPYYKLYISFSYLILLVTSLLYFKINTVIQLYIIQHFVGLACGMQFPAFNATFGKLLKQGREAKGWGLYSSTSCFGVAVSAFIGSQLIHYFSFYAVFSFMAISNAIAFIASLFLPKIQSKA